MSPLQMAKEQCANLVSGICLGIPWQCLDGSRPIVGQEQNGCKLSDPKTRCDYFEVVVAPLVQYFPRYAKAVATYNKRLAKQEAPPVVTANLWTCDCGKPMSKGRRMCDACTRKNKLAAKRRWKAKRSRATVDS